MIHQTGEIEEKPKKKPYKFLDLASKNTVDVFKQTRHDLRHSMELGARRMKAW